MHEDSIWKHSKHYCVQSVQTSTRPLTSGLMSIDLVQNCSTRPFDSGLMEIDLVQPIERCLVVDILPEIILAYIIIMTL